MRTAKFSMDGSGLRNADFDADGSCCWNVKQTQTRLPPEFAGVLGWIVDAHATLCENSATNVLFGRRVAIHKYSVAVRCGRATPRFPSNIEMTP